MPQPAAPAPVTSPDDLFSVAGRYAIVTGASSGLGRRFARLLHHGEATVVVAARRADRLEALADELGDGIVPVACDLTDDDDRRRLVDAALEAGDGRIDVLVNNAGLGVVGRAEDEAPDTWERVVSLNLTSVFRLSQLVGRVMLGQGSGSIVNISSILGQVASAPIGQASYSATKGAILNLTRELACQWARKGVRVNAIAPGFFRTDMADKMFSDPASAEFLARNCPMQRGGEEGELDGTLLLLASAAGSYITGAVLDVDGGWTAR